MDTLLGSNDIAAIAPLLTLFLGGLVVLLCATFEKKHIEWITCFVLLVAIAFAIWSPPSTHPLLTRWLTFDTLSRQFTLFFLLIGLGATFLASIFKGEYFFLLLSALFGLILIGSSADFLTLFIGIETLSLSLYILCGYRKGSVFSAESAMKYFLLGSLAAAFLLYGIALIYGATGTTQFVALQAAKSESTLFLVGILFITFALSFEIAAVPFHFWAPEVYEGAATPVTAFMAVGTKVGAFAAFIRVFMQTWPPHPLWSQAMALIAVLTLLYSNLLAIRQTQLKRFFAYSGISHAGFLILPLLVGTPDAEGALLFYLVVYSFATLGCFAVISFLDDEKGANLNSLKGLFRRSPWLAALFSLCLITLAGIPPTVGFFAKFYIFKIAFQAGYTALVIFALLTTILSAYYYLRIIAVMFAEAPEQMSPPTTRYPSALVGAICFFGLLLFSFLPSLINFGVPFHR